MSAKSFSSRLSWRIIVIVSAISVLAQLAVFFAYRLLLDSPLIYVVMVSISLASLAAIFFICRAVINRMTRPVAELSDAQERLEADLDLAQKIQKGMLRTDFPPQLYALLNPARHVGGDLYDFTLKGDQLYFAIGDVSGKGIASSLVMAITRVMLRFVVGLGLPLDETLRRINDNFSETNETGMFVTLFVARIDLKTGHMDYCNAGHNPILIIPNDEKPYFLKCKSNIAMGLFEHFGYEAEQMDLKPGTRLIAYTDGVTEAEKRDQSLYGDERLMEWASHTVETFPETSSQEQDIVKSLYDSVQAFTDGNPQNDDITIVSLRI